MFVAFTPTLTVHADETDVGIGTQEVDIAQYEEALQISVDTHGETWYDLKVVDGVPQLPHSVDYSSRENLIKSLKPGDLVYEAAGSFGITGHSAMVYDILYSTEYEQYYAVVIEAVAQGVSYGLLTPTRLADREGQIKRVTDATKTQINNAVNWAKNQIGKNYSISMTKNASADSATWYCSELVWASYYWQGIYLDSDDNKESGGSVVFPSELNDYANAKLIMHYQYDTVYSALDDKYHTLTCLNDVITEAHEYVQLNSCYMQCDLCNYIKQTASHDYTIYEQNDATSHYVYCECGSYIQEEHTYSDSATHEICEKCGYHKHVYTSYTASGNGLYHVKTCFCGYSKIEACKGVALIGEPAYCYYCGQEIRSLTTLEDDETADIALKDLIMCAYIVDCNSLSKKKNEVC